MMELSTLQELIEGDFPACPAATLRDALRRSQRELCEDGNAWVVEDGPVVFGANTEFATVEPPLDAEAVRILSLTYKGRQMKPGRDYAQTGDNQVKFYREVTESDIDGRLACKPEVGADMPEELLAKWSDAISDGARSILYMQPQPWRDLQMADYYRSLFQSHKAHARDLAFTGYQAGSVRMRIPQF